MKKTYGYIRVSTVAQNDDRQWIDTQIPSVVLLLPNVEYGGTGFFYDKAVPLPDVVEHTKPDYHLYDDWVKTQLAAGKKRQDFRY